MTFLFSFFLAFMCPGPGALAQGASSGPARLLHPLFVTADLCMACHNGLVSPSGEDVSIGADWRGSMMANAARDPYWHAAVRREVTDHPTARAAIENECAACHMPMDRFQAKAAGLQGEIFAHLPPGERTGPADLLAADGVSCTTCHQILPEGLGEKRSFTGGFAVDTGASPGQRKIFGSFEIDPGRSTIMRSASGFQPAQGMHIESSEMCATCHTLFTHALGPDGEVIGELAEQVPYLEWRHSAYRNEQSCQSCHMPVVEAAMPISAVLGEPREGFSRHVFRGGNFFIPRVFARFGGELGVSASSGEFDSTAQRSLAHLQSGAARIAIENAALTGGRIEAEVAVENLAGHKLPTAYPSRRVWLRFVVLDGNGKTVFESGRLDRNGSIVGNDNDADAARFEPHYDRIDDAGQVQVYEVIMAGADDAVTTGLLTGIRYIKDNRILPRGFDKASAGKDIATFGRALQDSNFAAGGDRIRYLAKIGEAEGPFTVRAELWYQPIAYRWAQNFRRYEAPETARFLTYYEALSDYSAVLLAQASTKIDRGSRSAR